MAAKSPITCHVLDGALGKPGAGIKVTLEHVEDGQSSGATQSKVLAEGVTDGNGRCSDLLDPASTRLHGAAVYRMTFHTKPYFAQAGRDTFYPRVEILFQLPDQPDPHYHIPLLISPFSYSTYRGS